MGSRAGGKGDLQTNILHMRRSPGDEKIFSNEKVIIEAIKLVTLQTPYKKRFKTSVPESVWETKIYDIVNLRVWGLEKGLM